VLAITNYIVAATPRTGSSLLCEGLWAAGIAGRPAEVFAPDFRKIWREHWSLPADCSVREYVRTAVRNGTTENGVFGVKIQWMHVPVLARDLGLSADCDVLESLFAGGRFVNIVRRDRVAQALSWFRAIHSNDWWSFQHVEEGRPRNPPPVLDLAEVQSLCNEIARQQNEWERYFQRRRLNPLVVEYEELAGDYAGQVARALRFLDLDAGAAKTLPEPRLARQADEVTAHWRRLMDTGVERRVGN
jgi:LPS sulfotransferase NodH